jgi:indole-3-glycerol phosphate synthase
MTDFMDTIAMNAIKTIESGYYQNIHGTEHKKVSLKTSIANCARNAVITEIKPASPSLGIIRTNINPFEIAKAMQRGGATGISVLTEPIHFNGSLETLAQTRNAVKLPILMKDIIIVPDQIDAGAKLGADAVLLIQTLFDRNCTEMNLQKTIAYAHNQSLEVLLETHTEAEFQSALDTDADVVGINNRDLSTLKIDLETTCRILAEHENPNKLVISESGIQTPEDLKRLRCCGARGFLVGSSIMLTDDIEAKVKEYVNTP